MKPKLIIVLATIVIVPLVILGWLGVRVVRGEQAMLESQFRKLVAGQFRVVELELEGALVAIGQTIVDEASQPLGGPDGFRERLRASPLCEQYYVLDQEGRLVFPPLSAVTQDERRSLERTRELWEEGAVLAAAAAAEQPTARTAGGSSTLPQRGLPSRAASGSANWGWHPWYDSRGLELMFWQRQGDRTFAAELNRSRLIAELIAVLPETEMVDPDIAGGRIRLLDRSGRPIYQWGAFEPAENALPDFQSNLSAPLGAWSLQYFAPSALAGGEGLLVNLMLGLILLGLVLGAMAFWFYREQSRAMREATQRVSFVNQVSHELKTPLTNIRMYAELLEQDLEESERGRRNVEVIVSESRRLSRLIGNVLTFGRGQRQGLELHRATGVVDEVVADVVQGFAPALRRAGITPELQLAAANPASIDRDVLEQILGNLLNNVEKYAALGGTVTVSTRQDGNRVSVEVADAGPGIPERDRQRVFEPFVRLSEGLTEGVAGTGIGLALARDLARVHGGELELVEAGRGATFCLTLHCPLQAGQGDGRELHEESP